MNNNEINAKALCEAIRKFAENPTAIENFESYLSYHFDKWIEKYANTPEGLISELNHFAAIEN